MTSVSGVTITGFSLSHAENAIIRIKGRIANADFIFIDNPQNNRSDVFNKPVYQTVKYI